MAKVNPSGAAAPLDETGYAAVADRCCQAEMKVFIERQVFNMGMTVCETDGLTGIVPYHSCEKGPQTFATLSANLLADSEKECTWLAAPGKACKPMPASCPTFEGITPLADCGCSQSKAVSLSFEGATLLTNNLGGLGPNKGDPQEIRFGNIGEYPAGQAFDLKIVAIPGEPFNNKAGFVNLNGLWYQTPKFGNIALDNSGRGAGYVNEARMQFTFLRPGSETPVELPEFFIAVFDIDGSVGLKGVQTISSKGYKGYVTDVDTELIASKAADGSTKFTATQEDVTNPSDPMTATKKQRQSMVMYFYSKVSTFEFTLGLVGSGARNFNFAGKSALVDRCGA